MGNAGARSFGLEKAEITLEESMPGLLKVVSGDQKNPIRTSCHKKLAN